MRDLEALARAVTSLILMAGPALVLWILTKLATNRLAFWCAIALAILAVAR